jgi:hypothetical protein
VRLVLPRTSYLKKSHKTYDIIRIVFITCGYRPALTEYSVWNSDLVPATAVSRSLTPVMGTGCHVT